MSSSISLKPTHLILSSFSTGKVLHFRRSRFSHRSSSSSRYRTLVAQFGFRPGSFPDLGDSLDFIKDHAENLLYTIADAAVSSSETFESVAGTTSTTNQNNDWFSGIANYMETILKVYKVLSFWFWKNEFLCAIWFIWIELQVLKDGLSTVHVPYSYGFAIILLTVLVKAATFPLTKKQVFSMFLLLLSHDTIFSGCHWIVGYSLQVESAMAMKSLTPQIKAIQERYAGDQVKTHSLILQTWIFFVLMPYLGYVCISF